MRFDTMIPVCEPTLKGNERKYVLECLETNWISSKGKYIDLFEGEFSSYCNRRFGVACSSGTAALHLALSALDIGPGDEVIVPTFTMIATCNAVLYCGATPILVDAGEEDWCIDVGKIEERITGRTRAIIPVHIYGHPCDMDPILDLAGKYGLSVVEDAAEAIGAEYRGRRLGSLSDASCFSFYANKTVTTGEGGMVVTDNERAAARLRKLRDQAFSTRRFLHEEMGYNYRMTNIQAAIGAAQMEYIDELVDARIRNARLYDTLLGEIDGVCLPPRKESVKNVHWMYGILIEDEFGISKSEVMTCLDGRGIGTRSFFHGMHLQPVYRNFEKVDPGRRGGFPVSDELTRKGLYLPSGSSLTESEIHRVVKSIHSSREQVR